MLIKNCHLISPDLDLADAALEIQDGLIKTIYRSGEALPGTDSTYDARGKMVLPGFVDIHFHGLYGDDVADGTAEGLVRIAEGKLDEGVTSIAPTTLTLPEEELSTIMETIAAYAQGRPSGAKFAGVHLEGPYINPSCTGAQNPAYVRQPDLEEIKRLNAIAKVAQVTFAVEEQGGVDFTRGLRELGVVPSCGHSAANYAQFKEGKDAGLCHLTHFCNQMTPLHHRDIGLVGAGLLDDDIMIEMICDRIHLCPEMIALAFKNKPIEKIALITDAMSASGLENGNYKLGGLPVVVKDGAARLASDGALAGSTLRFNQALKNVYEITGLPLSQLVKTTSLNQATEYSLGNIGKLEPGYAADIVVLDDDFAVADVFVDGVRRPTNA
jgi:N-acetylglucosamine-6-phosphate deacetylase